MEFDPVLVHDWLTRSAHRYPDKIALVCGDGRWTYRQLDDSSTNVAFHLVEHGIARHDRLAVFAGNTAETLLAVYGALKAGAAFMVLNPTIKADKLRYVLDDSGAAALVAAPRCHRVVCKALKDASLPCRVVVWAGDHPGQEENLPVDTLSWSTICGPFEPNSVVPPRVIDVDLAALIYTSGSTGFPKGVMSTHHNMVAAARSIIQYLENHEDDVVMNVLPLSFDYGLYQAVMTFMFGGTLVLEPSFMYLERIVSRMSAENVTGFPMVPTIAAMLLDGNLLETHDLSTLRYITNTAAALCPEHIKALRERLPHVRLFSMYGLTECKRVSYLAPSLVDEVPLSVGTAMPNCEAFVADANGDPLPPDSDGELVIRGSNIMQGYWGDPALTAQAYPPGRWRADVRLRSGDTFRYDRQGHLYFLGRRDDMIKSQGERISPREIENVLLRHPFVTEAVVLGTPDPVMGQMVHAVVVPVPDCRLTPRDVRGYCTQHLESFKVPGRVTRLKKLPKLPNGKLDMPALRRQVDST